MKPKREFIGPEFYINKDMTHHKAFMKFPIQSSAAFLYRDGECFDISGRDSIMAKVGDLLHDVGNKSITYFQLKSKVHNRTKRAKDSFVIKKVKKEEKPKPQKEDMLKTNEMRR